MVWLIRHSSLEPRYCPSFMWQNVPRDLLSRLGFEALRPEESIPVPIAQRSAHDRKKSPLPDFFGIVGVGVVSESFKSLVEGLEPGIHQFLPVTLLDKGGTALTAKYYVLHIDQLCGGDKGSQKRDIARAVELNEQLRDE